jgi:hypothetical protein
MTIFLFLFGYSYFFVSAFIYFFVDPDKENDIKSPILSLLKIIFSLQGIYLPLIRLAEPAIIYTLKKNLRSVFCYSHIKREKIDLNSLLERSESFTRESTVWGLDKSGELKFEKP